MKVYLSRIDYGDIGRIDYDKRRLEEGESKKSWTEMKNKSLNDKKEYILCAAIKRKTPINVESKNYKTYTLEDDDIYSIEIGRRHNDIMARFGKDVLCLTQQGFYTSFGRFVSREEALQIAKDAGQVKEPDSGKLYVFDKLYSEDLY